MIWKARFICGRFRVAGLREQLPQQQFVLQRFGHPQQALRDVLAALRVGVHLFRNDFRNFVDEKIPFRQSDREDQSHDVAVQCFHRIVITVQYYV